MLTGDSAIRGAATFSDGTAVRPISRNLSKSRPERTPHQSAARARRRVVRLMTNSPVRLIIAWEWRSGRTEIKHIGRSEQTVPVHATVSMLYSSGAAPQLTSTAGSG